MLKQRRLPDIRRPIDAYDIVAILSTLICTAIAVALLMGWL
jgi:hypothetical protein